MNPSSSPENKALTKTVVDRIADFKRKLSLLNSSETSEEKINLIIDSIRKN
jgi:hypothetical protein